MSTFASLGDGLISASSYLICSNVLTKVVFRGIASAAIEYPNVVLLLPGSAELFDRSKTPSTVDQFVPKGDPHFTVGTLDSRPDYQGLSFPPKVRQHCHSVLGGADVAPVRLQLVFVLQGPVRANKRLLVPEAWIAVLDSHNTALHGGSSGAESAGLPVQYPFAGKIGLLLGDC
jgi:hypothetical protein